MKSTDSIRNNKTLNANEKNNFETISSGKIWAKKIKSLSTKDPEKQQRLSKLGGQTAEVERLNTRILDQPKNAFQVSTYRASKDSSINNDS